MTRKCDRCTEGTEECYVGDCWICDTCDRSIDPLAASIEYPVTVEDIDTFWNDMDWDSVTLDSVEDEEDAIGWPVV